MKRLLIVAAVLVVVINVAVFARVAYNRSGEPKVVTLTERELSLPYGFYRKKKENSGLRLNIEWQITEQDLTRQYYGHNRSYTVGKAVLEQLGFNAPESCGGIKKARGGRDKSRKGWVLLQYDGPAHAHEVTKFERYFARRRYEIGKVEAEPEQKELQRIADRLEYLKKYQSRLYVVNVALDRETLLKNNTVRPQDFILAAEISNASYCDNNRAVLKVLVSELLPESMNVPRRFHDFFERLPGVDDRGGEHLPRFRAEIAVGKLNEPWLLGLEKYEAD